MNNYFRDDKTTLLKTHIEATLGQAIKYSKDCEVLSEDVFQRTRKQLSASTLKRFFGLVSGQHTPSASTLDTLAFYTGFSDWGTFLKAARDADHHSARDEEILEHLRGFTQREFEPLRKHYAHHSLNRLPRMQLSRKFDDFVHRGTERLLLAYASPEYYPEHFLVQWMDEKLGVPRGQKVWFYLSPGGSPFTLGPQHAARDKIRKGLELLQQTLMQQNLPTALNNTKQSFVLVFNGLYLKPYDAEALQEHIEALFRAVLSIADSRLILLFHPEAADWLLNTLEQTAVENTGNQKIIQFRENDFALDIPSLNNFIRQTRTDWDIHKIKASAIQLPNILTIPGFLHGYVGMLNKNGKPPDVLGFFYTWVNLHILSAPHGTGNMKFLNHFFEQTAYLTHAQSLPANHFQLQEQHIISYLVNRGVMKREKRQGKYLAIEEYLGFKTPEICEFLLINQLLRRFGPSQELIVFIGSHYQEHPELRRNLQAWLMLFFIDDNEEALISQLFHHILENEKLSPAEYLLYINQHKPLNTLFIHLRQTGSREVLLQHILKMPHMQDLYFKGFIDLDSLHTFLHNAQELEKKNTGSPIGYWALSIQLLAAVFRLETAEARQYYKQLMNFEPGVPQAAFGLPEFAQRLYWAIIEGKAPHETDRILPYPQQAPSSESEVLDTLFYCHYLFITGQYSKMHRICSKTFPVVHNQSNLQHSHAIQIMRLLRAYAQTAIGDTKAAYTTLAYFKPLSLGINSHNYWMMCNAHIRSLLYEAEDNMAKAAERNLVAQRAAEALGYTYFIEKFRKRRRHFL